MPQRKPWPRRRTLDRAALAGAILYAVLDRPAPRPGR